MVRFKLRSQQTGQVREFSLRDVLNAFGDITNDEIRFPDGNREDVFNLSSFEDLSDSAGGNGGSTTNTTKLVSEAIPFVHNQQEVTLGTLPVTLCLVFLNGIKLRQGVDYTKNGKIIQLLFPLKATESHTDLLETLYDTAA